MSASLDLDNKVIAVKLQITGQLNLLKLIIQKEIFKNLRLNVNRLICAHLNINSIRNNFGLLGIKSFYSQSDSPDTPTSDLA